MLSPGVGVGVAAGPGIASAVGVGVAAGIIASGVGVAVGRGVGVGSSPPHAAKVSANAAVIASNARILLIASSNNLRQHLLLTAFAGC